MNVGGQRAMRSHRGAVAALACCLAVVCVAALLAGCSVGGGSTGTGGDPATLVVTRDFGEQEIGKATFGTLPAGPTVMRLLQGAFNVGTSYGGRFVTGIEGIDSSTSPRRDWLYYVNGVEAPRGAAATRVVPGDRVQWDLHRWDAIPVGGAIVGAFPQPFKKHGARVDCLIPGDPACALVRQALRVAGVRVSEAHTAVPVYVGEAQRFRGQDDVPDLRAEPAVSGAFAQLTGFGELSLFDEAGVVRRVVRDGAGVILALTDGDRPVWVVAGVGATGTTDAAELLVDARLRNRFGVLAQAGRPPQSLPLRGAP